jgi:hypothetical protein
LQAFYERLRARRGHGIAVVVAARKLTVLLWCLLTRGEEQYAHQQPSLTGKKLRRLELTAGAKRYDTKAAGIWSTNQAMREAERSPCRPKRPTCGWSKTGKRPRRAKRWARA